MCKSILRKISILVILSIIISVFASCTTVKVSETEKPTGAEKSAEIETAKKEATSYPDLKEHVHVDTIGHDDPKIHECIESYLTEKLGRKVVLQRVPNATYNEKVSTMFLARDYPDTINLDRLPEVFVQYKLGGHIIPLTKYIKNSDKLRYLLEKHEKVMMDFMYDHEIWGIPRDKYSTKNLWIRTDWLDNLGLKIPETTDEYLEVLRKFKTGNPSKSIKQDEIIPLVVANYIHELFIFVYAFGGNYLFKEDKDGNVSDGFTEPELKEALDYIKVLIKEELLDKEFITCSNSLLRQKTATMGIAGSSIYWGSRYSWFNVETKKSFPEAIWEMIPILKGPRGEYGIYQDGVGSPYCITSGSKNPEQAFEFLELLFGTQEGAWLFGFGYPYYIYKDKGIDKEILEKIAIYDIKDGKVVPTDYTLQQREAGIYPGTAFGPLSIYCGMPQFQPLFPSEKVDPWIQKWIDVQPVVDAAVVPYPRAITMEDEWCAMLVGLIKEKKEELITKYLYDEIDYDNMIKLWSEYWGKIKGEKNLERLNEAYQKVKSEKK